MASLFEGRRAGFRPVRPLQGALDVLVGAGFFTREALEEALTLATDLLPEQMPMAAARAARVVNNFKKAAD
jgi:hypothetical protein